MKLKYIILFIIVVTYVWFTWSIQEGYSEPSQLMIDDDEWKTVQTELKTIIDDTSKKRHVVLYNESSSLSNITSFLESDVDPQDNDVKVVVQIASFSDYNKQQLIELLNSDEPDSLLYNTVYTFDMETTSSIVTPIPKLGTTETTETTETTDLPEPTESSEPIESSEAPVSETKESKKEKKKEEKKDKKKKK